jgi:hypothetical protein
LNGRAYNGIDFTLINPDRFTTGESAVRVRVLGFG